MDPRFKEDGCCLLDYYLLWAEQAIRDKNPDEAYRWSKMLAHCLLALIERQRPIDPYINRHFAVM